MKKRIVSIILAAAFALTAMPAMAASVNKGAVGSVTNVKKHITLFGTRYITYDFNGMTVDSRNAGAKYNRMAFELMNDSDKYKVYDAYWPGADRTEQFGEEGAKAISDFINDKKGWSRAWKEYQDKIGNKYLSELRGFYGGVEAADDSQSLYNKEIDRLTSFEEGTAAYTLLTKYGSYEEAGELWAMYHSIPEMMKTGKAAYDTCVNGYYMSISAGTKAMSTYVLNLIVDNCMVPGTFAAPSATLAGTRTAGYTMVLAARNAIRDRIAKITGYSHTFIDERSREAMQGGGGTSPEEGAKAFRQYQQIIAENYGLATYCHNRAEKFHDYIESHAQSAVNEIEANRQKSNDYYTKTQEEYRAELERAKNAGEGVSRGNTYYSRIMAKKPTADPEKDPELYEKQYEAMRKEAEACTRELNTEFDSWKSAAVDEIAELARSIGYDEVTGLGLPAVSEGSQSFINLDNISSRMPYEPDWMEYYWQQENMENFREENDFSAYKYDDEAMSVIESEARAAKEKYASARIKRDSIISAAQSLYARQENEYKSLYSKAKGIADAWYFDLSSYEAAGSNILTGSVTIENFMNDYKDGSWLRIYYSYDYGSGQDYYSLRIKRIDENMSVLRERLRDYKQETQKKINDYIHLQNLDDALISEHNRIVEERNAILDEAPDYVKEQGLQNYNFKYVWAVGNSDVYTLNPKNSLLQSKINDATPEYDGTQPWFEKARKAKNDLLKKEADKLEPMYEKLRSLDRRMDYLGEIEGRLKKSFYPIYDDNHLYWENLSGLGLDTKNMHYGTAEAYNSSWYTEDYDREKRAMKLLIADFRGTGALQMEFMKAYGEYKAKRAAAARALKSGMMTSDDFRRNVYGPVSSAHSRLISGSTAPTYARDSVNVGMEDEIYLEDMINADDSDIRQVMNIADDPDSYIPVESLSSETAELSDAVTLNEGGSVRLDVSVYPPNATFKGILWESPDPEIAEVDENGVVKANSEGTVTIRAIAEDAPMTEITDEDGNVTGYEAADEFVKEFTINVGSSYTYDTIGENEDEGYTWANYGTEDAPRYTNAVTEGGTTTISARFNSPQDGAEVIMAVYAADGRLIGASPVTNDGVSSEVSVSFKTSDRAERVKVLTWYGTQSCEPYTKVLIEEEVNA